MEIRKLENTILQQLPDFDNHEQITNFTDKETGLNAYIAIHNTNLGPALGGCRMTSYPGEQDAIRDVLRLSRGMTYKNALAGLPLGGGKSVIVGDPFKHKTEDLMGAMGRAVEFLNGRYITAEDSGTKEQDMRVIARETSYVVGMRDEDCPLGGDPSPVTAYGVFNGIKAAAARRYGTDSVKGLTVAIQGLGAVGYGLCRHLDQEGASLIVTDVREETLEKARKEFRDVKIVAPEDIFGAKADIFAPCALGAQINDQTIPLLKAQIVAGAANNQLATAAHELKLLDRDILYVPDYVINAGGVISACYEYFVRTGRNPFQYELTRENLMAHVERIGPTITKIFNIADARKITPGQAADELAEAIFRGEAETGFNQARRSSAG